MSTQPAPQANTSAGRPFTIAGLVCGIVAIIFIPPLFGILGIIFGFVGYARGDKPLGLYVGIGSIITLILGMVLGAIVFNASN